MSCEPCHTLLYSTVSNERQGGNYRPGGHQVPERISDQIAITDQDGEMWKMSVSDQFAMTLSLVWNYPQLLGFKPLNFIQAIKQLFVADFIRSFIRNTQNFKPLLKVITNQDGQNHEKTIWPGCNKTGFFADFQWAQVSKPTDHWVFCQNHIFFLGTIIIFG